MTSLSLLSVSALPVPFRCVLTFAIIITKSTNPCPVTASELWKRSGDRSIRIISSFRFFGGLVSHGVTFTENRMLLFNLENVFYYSKKYTQILFFFTLIIKKISSRDSRNFENGVGDQSESSRRFDFSIASFPM